MSRNFELLAQIESEREIGAQQTRSQVSGIGAESQEIAPFFSSRLNDSGGEEMLRLVQRIFVSRNGNAPRQVVLCGVDGENGSSSVCASAGRTLAANSSRSVCLVDANVRSPRLSRIFDVDKTSRPSGVTPAASKHCVQIEDRLWLAGPSLLADDSQVLLPVDELRERLSQLRELFEYVLIDAPGTSVCGDAQLLGQVADAAILVVEANRTRRLTARKAKENLDAAGVRLLGTVLHNRSFPIPGKLYKRL